jgi:hypothetical protein
MILSLLSFSHTSFKHRRECLWVLGASLLGAGVDAKQ